MKKRFGIQTRWLSHNLALTAGIVLLLAAGLVLFISLRSVRSLSSSLKTKLAANIDVVEDYVASSPDDASFYDSVYSYTQNYEDRNNFMLEFLDSDGKIVCSSYDNASGGTPGTADIVSALTLQKASVFRGKSTEADQQVMAVSGLITAQDGSIIGVLRLVSSMHSVNAVILRWSFGAFIVFLLIIALQLANGLWFMRTAITPISEITETSGRIAAGGYGTQIQRELSERNDEIGELTRTINNLSLQISQTERLQSEFLSSCSHELRTPLTAISGWAETLLDGDELDPDFTRRGIGTILSESKRLTSLVMELLEFSRIQDGRFKLNVEDCDLRAVFEDTIFMYGSRLKQQGIDLEYEDSDEEIPEIRCDPERMKQVFLNILDNAAKYGGSGGRIDCSIQIDEEYLTVKIRDYGPGIPEDELPLVKKKFYKGSAGTRGNGIGLAVCEEIVTVHGGNLIIANADDGTTGCVVTIELPANQ